MRIVACQVAAEVGAAGSAIVVRVVAGCPAAAPPAGAPSEEVYPIGKAWADAVVAAPCAACHLYGAYACIGTSVGAYPSNEIVLQVCETPCVVGIGGAVDVGVALGEPLQVALREVYLLLSGDAEEARQGSLGQRLRGWVVHCHEEGLVFRFGLHSIRQDEDAWVVSVAVVPVAECVAVVGYGLQCDGVALIAASAADGYAVVVYTGGGGDAVGRQLLKDSPIRGIARYGDSARVVAVAIAPAGKTVAVGCRGAELYVGAISVPTTAFYGAVGTVVGLCGYGVNDVANTNIHQRLILKLIYLFALLVLVVACKEREVGAILLALSKAEIILRQRVAEGERGLANRGLHIDLLADEERTVVRPYGYPEGAPVVYGVWCGETDDLRPVFVSTECLRIDLGAQAVGIVCLYGFCFQPLAHLAALIDYQVEVARLDVVVSVDKVIYVKRYAVYLLPFREGAEGFGTHNEFFVALQQVDGCILLVAYLLPAVASCCRGRAVRLRESERHALVALREGDSAPPLAAAVVVVGGDGYLCRRAVALALRWAERQPAAVARSCPAAACRFCAAHIAHHPFAIARQLFAACGSHQVRAVRLYDDNFVVIVVLVVAVAARAAAARVQRAYPEVAVVAPVPAPVEMEKVVAVISVAYEGVAAPLAAAGVVYRVQCVQLAFQQLRPARARVARS